VSKHVATDLRFEAAESLHLLELPGQAVLAKDRLSALVLKLSKQQVDQLNGERVCCFLFLGFLVVITLVMG